MQIPAGFVVDKLPKKNFMLVITVLSVILMLVFLNSKNFYLGTISRIALGLVNAPAVALSYAVVADVVSKYRFASVIGILETISLIGLAIAVIFAEGLTGNVISLNAVKVICVGFGVILISLNLGFLKNDKVNDEHIDTKDLIRKVKKILVRKDLWFAGVYSGLLFVPISVLAPIWIIPYVKSLYVCSNIKAALASIMILVGASFGIIAICRLSDKIKERKYTMVVCSIISSILSIIFIYYPPADLTNMLLLLFVFGFSLGSYMLPFAYIKERCEDEVRGSAMGFANMLCFIAGAPVVQPLIAHVLDSQEVIAKNAFVVYKTIHYQKALTCFPIICFISIILALCLKKRY